MNYIRQKYGNPPVLIMENGTVYSSELHNSQSSYQSYSTDLTSMSLSPGMDQPGNLTHGEYLRDCTRVGYYRSYLSELKRAIDGGANVHGFFAWALLDNFEWLLGYTSKFGIVYIDFNTLERHPKQSAYWFRDLLQH